MSLTPLTLGESLSLADLIADTQEYDRLGEILLSSKSEESRLAGQALTDLKNSAGLKYLSKNRKVTVRDLHKFLSWFFVELVELRNSKKMYADINKYYGDFSSYELELKGRAEALLDQIQNPYWQFIRKRLYLVGDDHGSAAIDTFERVANSISSCIQSARGDLDQFVSSLEKANRPWKTYKNRRKAWKALLIAAGAKTTKMFGVRAPKFLSDLFNLKYVIEITGSPILNMPSVEQTFKIAAKKRTPEGLSAKANPAKGRGVNSVRKSK